MQMRCCIIRHARLSEGSASGRRAADRKPSHASRPVSTRRSDVAFQQLGRGSSRAPSGGLRQPRQRRFRRTSGPAGHIPDACFGASNYAPMPVTIVRGWGLGFAITLVFYGVKAMALGAAACASRTAQLRRNVRDNLVAAGLGRRTRFREAGDHAYDDGDLQCLFNRASRWELALGPAQAGRSTDSQRLSSSKVPLSSAKCWTFDRATGQMRNDRAPAQKARRWPRSLNDQHLNAGVTLAAPSSQGRRP